MSIFGTMRNYLPKKDVDVMMNDYLSKRAAKQTTPAEYVKGGLLATKQGLEALQASQGSFAERNQLVDDPQTGMKIPYFEYLKRQGLAARGYQAAEAPMQQNTVERGLAPPPSPQLGGAEQPSAPAPAPTTAGYPSGYLGGAQKEFYQEQAKSFATQAEKIGAAASNAADSQTQITELKKILPKIESQLGLLSKEGLTTAKFFAQIDPDDRYAVVQEIYGESDPKKQKEIISNLEAFDKLTLLENVEAAKAAIGARVTNNEFQKFSTALTNLRTTGKGAKQILDFMEKLNKIIQMKNAYMASYRDTHRGMKHQFDINEFERGWNEALKANPKLYKFESPTEEE